MPQLFHNTQLNTQKDESGLVELFNLNRLVQTVNSIAIEAKDEEEMLQLTINALCIFTGCPRGHIFLRDAAHRNIFNCSNTRYEKHFDLDGEPRKNTPSNAYDESNPAIRQMTAHLAPTIHRDDASFKVLIPIVSRGKLFGFFELVASKEEEEPNQHLLQVFHQVGYRIGSVLDSFVTSKELEAAKANDEAILSSVGEGLVVADSKEAIVLVNKAATDMLKWKAHEMVGKPWFEVLKPIDKNGKVLPIEERPLHLARVSGKKVFAGRYEFLRKDKTQFPVAITATPVSLEGESIGAVIVFRDATQEREIERMREEMISLTSHQLKSPLTIIKWTLDLLRQGKLGAKEKKLVDEAGTITKSMYSLIVNLLNVSKIEQGRIDFKSEPLQFEDIIDSVIKRLSPIAQKRKVSIEFKKSTKLLPKVKADSEYFKEAIQNVIANAIDYTKDRVIIELKKQDDAILFACGDNGIGIPKEEQSKIFSKFYRTSNAKQAKLTGTGLGLSITKAVIERLGGKVWFNSEEGKGTNFYITLPFIKPR